MGTQQVFIAMLRGINVSGQKKIKMADLREHLSEIPLYDVRTYIQSGNIVFRSEQTPEPLEAAIRSKIEKKYGFDVPTLVKTPKEFETAIAGNPYGHRMAEESKRVYITFLSDIPEQPLVDNLKSVDHSPEEWVLKGKDIYFYSPHGYGNAKMSNNYFEAKLKVKATTRNWKTIVTLLDMANSI